MQLRSIKTLVEAASRMFAKLDGYAISGLGEVDSHRQWRWLLHPEASAVGTESEGPSSSDAPRPGEALLADLLA
ncbi:MAG: hypothetical protein E5X43_33920, partial [Mesorhizobium sp.]